MAIINVIIAFKADRLAHITASASAQGVGDLSRLNQRLHNGDNLFKLWAESKGGKAIATGTGNGCVEVAASHIEELYNLKTQYKDAVDTTVSIGVGTSLHDAEMALEYAVKTGGNIIELFTEELQQNLAELEDDESTAAFNSFFDKAEPALNTPSAGGGMTGPHQSGPSAPQQGMGEGSEHSENEVLQSEIAGQPDLLGQMQSLATQSQAKEASDQQSAQNEQEQQGQSNDLKDAVIGVLTEFKEQGELWEQLKQASPDGYKVLTDMMQAMIQLARQAFQLGDGEGEETRGSHPSSPMAKSVSQRTTKKSEWTSLGGHVSAYIVPGTGTVAIHEWTSHVPGQGHTEAALRDLGRKYGRIHVVDPGPEGTESFNYWKHMHGKGLVHSMEDEDGKAIHFQKPELPGQVHKEPVQKNMAPALHSSVESFMTGLKGLPTGGPERGKFITSHMNHPAFLTALQAHPQGQKVHAMLTSFLNSKANAGVGVGVKTVAKALNPLEVGTTGRHQVILPVGSQIDAGPSGTRKVQRIKILDRITNKTKWRQVRAGMVMDPQGNPTSSRNPSGGVEQ